MFGKITINAGSSLLTHVRYYARKGPNPGMSRMLKNFNDTKEMEDDAEGFGDIESDLMQSHEMHKMYKNEEEHHRQKVKHWIVKNKYFKEKLPNFLTYAEKEQIKLLHTRDPEEWNPEKLSESFPASPEIISKIIKANWMPQSEKRIRKHDEEVMKNWSMFTEGKFTRLNGALNEHIRKFVKRNTNDMKNITISKETKPELPKPSKTEFSNIITSCKKYQEDNTKLLENTSTINNSKQSNPFRKVHPSTSDDETYLTDKIINRKPIRFRDLTLQQDTNLVEQSQQELKLHQNNNPGGTGIVQVSTNNDHITLGMNKFDVNEVEISQRDLINLTNDPIRERIRIPSKVWRKGLTYKVRDCYYDDDGSFLYRVPGMTGLKR